LCRRGVREENIRVCEIGQRNRGKQIRPESIGRSARQQRSEIDDAIRVCRHCRAKEVACANRMKTRGDEVRSGQRFDDQRSLLQT
jgi:hypothetical protein